MATLYEIINEIEGDDLTQYFTKKEIKNIASKIEKNVKKKIGDANYQKLEQYVTDNKDEENLKELVEYLSMTEGLTDAIAALVTGMSDKTYEIKAGYNLQVKLHEKLEATNYDAEQALLDI